MTWVPIWDATEKKYRYPVLTLMEVMLKKGALSQEQARFFAPERPLEELYDLRQDRHELNNLAEDPAYAETLARMRTVLDRWLADADKGAYPENPGEIEFAEKLMEDRFRQNMARGGLSPEISDEDYLTWWMEKLDVGDMK